MADEHVNADFPLVDGRTFHTATLADDEAELPPYCLVVGSPSRASAMATELLNDARRVSEGDRGYDCYVGNYGDVPMAVAVHGMGSGSAITIFNELFASGARRFIRVGSCSSMVPTAQPGDIAIVNAAIRFDGASDELVHPSVPGVSDPKVLNALWQSAIDQGYTFHLGLGATSIGFYEGQGRPSVSGYVNPMIRQRMELLRHLQVVSCEMEVATLLTWAVVNRIEAGAVLAIYANRSQPDGGLAEKAGDEEAIKTGFMAMARLARSHPISTQS